jgi:carboxyl-terminal processing protease
MRRKLLLSIPLLLAASIPCSIITFGSEEFVASGQGTVHGKSQTSSEKVAAKDKDKDKGKDKDIDEVKPDLVYDHVWKLISEEYVDESFNGQSWLRWRHHYDGKLKTADDAHIAIETMLASLNDRYTRFLDKEAFSDERSQINARLFGIGVQIGTDKNHRIIVIAPIENTPAAAAGFTAGDEISEIDGNVTKGFSVEDAAKLIRGEVNTTVAITLTRAGKQIKVKVCRAEIPIKAVATSKMIDSDVGYIRLSSFISQEANSEMRDALASLSGAKGIILDLRDNPGGLLANAIDISNMFLDSGNIVSTVDRDGYKTAAPSDGKPLSRQPLILLVNKGSASASEITSGALRDNGRAVLVGQTTFGKGLVQNINKLEDGSGVNITIARYLTPNDTDINKKGIGPDFEVKVSENDLKEGKGPWWLDPESPTVKRAPEDLKDLQLKTALEVMHKKISDVNPVAIKALH